MIVAQYAKNSSPEYWDKFNQREPYRTRYERAENNGFFDMISKHCNGKILESGCGDGKVVEGLRNRNHNVVGIDYAPKSVLLAKNKGLNVHLMDSETTTFRNLSFDTVISLGVIEHEPGGSVKMMKEFNRILKQGGKLLLSVPYMNGLRLVISPYMVLHNLVNRVKGAGFYQNYYSIGSLKRHLEKFGFECEEFIPYGINESNNHMMLCVARKT